MRLKIAFIGLFILPCLLANGEEWTLQPSLQIYDRNGAPVRGFLSSNQTYARPLPLAQMSPWLLAAAVSAEDKRFFSHEGIDLKAIFRAAWQNASTQRIVSGASTITQQVVRAHHPHAKNWGGKLKETLQARNLEQQQTKEEILETYLNIVEFGNLLQGVEAASLFYFGVNARDLSAAQAAFLMGLVQSPTQYNPLHFFNRAIKRQQYVLKRMKEEGFLDEESWSRARKEKITLQARVRPFEAPHFTRLLQLQLPLNSREVFSTIDREVQLQAEQIVKNQLKNLADQNVTNAAVVVIENQTGDVLAYVGSGDFQDTAHNGQVDGARALRQPGSALKPFVYGLAFEKGILSPGSILMDEDTFFEGGFRPRNYDEQFHGLVSVRRSLACSYNIPAVKAAERVGIGNLLALLRQAGLTSLQREADFYGLGLALGNGEVRLLDLTNAYASLARGGLYKPVLLTQEPRVQIGGPEKRILTEQSAFLITDILKDNQARSAAFGLNSPLAVPFEMAAKTGTSKDYKDNFAFGYTPRWTIGVWVGNFDASSMQKVSGITGAGPILHDVAIYLQEKYPSSSFEEPDATVRKPVCVRSGLLAGPSCKHTQEELFSVAHLPSVCDGKHLLQKTERPSITNPTQGDIYKWDPAVPSRSQRVKWNMSCAENKCIWHLNGIRYPATTCEVFWPLEPGKFTLTGTCGGQTVQTAFEVLP